MKYLLTSGAMIGALAILGPGVARGQDTTAQSDTSMTQQAAGNRATQDSTQLATQDSTQLATPADSNSEVQNPQGYRGMERPVNVFPPDSGSEQARTPGAVEDRVTGTYGDSAWNDTTGTAQNPAGYRGMERPAALDSAAAASNTVTEQKAQPTTKKAKKAKDTKPAKKNSEADAARTPVDSQQVESPESR